MIVVLSYLNQSNGWASNTGGSPFSAVSDKVKVWNNANPLGANGTAWVAPVEGQPPFNPSGANCAHLWFCDRLARETGQDVRLVLIAKPATGVAYFVKGQALYSELAAVWAATGLTEPADIHVGHQGEANGDTTENVKAAYLQLIADLRADGFLKSDAPFIAGGLINQSHPSHLAWQQLASEDALIGFTPSSGLENDTQHFYGPALCRFGWSRYFETWQRMSGAQGSTVIDPDYFHIEERCPPGTWPGAIAGGVWQGRGSDGWVSLIRPAEMSTDRSYFRIPAGVWHIRATAPSAGARNHQIRLRDAGNVVLGVGSSSYCSDQSPAKDVSTESTLVTRVSLAAPTDMRLEHMAGVARDNYGLGFPNLGAACVPGVFARIEGERME